LLYAVNRAGPFIMSSQGTNGLIANPDKCESFLSRFRKIAEVGLPLNASRLARIARGSFAHATTSRQIEQSKVVIQIFPPGSVTPDLVLEKE
jgi:hypothetical protein